MPSPTHDASEKKWSLEDKADGNYVLFYCRVSKAMPDFGISETTHLPQDRPTFDFINDFFDREIKKKEKERIQKQKEERN
ncbi:hypothetical protein BFJ66_g11068 [Fusarium oxysporum f. sp. cepae]|uniref:Uncharacterized protein n=1 Tax=Fusarium oxysporum f. sp. cepae TaxID=396571 RepID=A0A3L6NYP5_FUSOX|nr:hypothetical protein BFJ65_g2942 [Fusarium oxysporum f. sp. cepae]RKK33209.1 hypothetical protein BFJ67_g14390 [Fusarium oxysporum f. sp. cepae]RKK41322.1 hypothetical protein BFJ66_g11068 [Fusarium oxysporum f. sp. cepae]